MDGSGDDTALSWFLNRPYFAASVTFMCFMYCLDGLWLNLRQLRCFKTSSLPAVLKTHMTSEQFEKSRAYQVERKQFGMIMGAWSMMQNLVILFGGLLPLFWQWAGQAREQVGLDASYTIVQSLLFFAIQLSVDTVLEIPWSLYDTFILEERHGFNKQTIGFFIKDTIKKMILNVILSCIVISALVYVVEWGGEYFYFYAWLFVFGFSVFMFAIYADFIAPLFDEFTELPKGNLRTEIEALADDLSFPLTKLFVINGSKRSAHSNAYFYGFHKNKRIVLFDTLIRDKQTIGGSESDIQEPQAEEMNEKTDLNDSSAVSDTKKETKAKGCTTGEIVAVLAHELGHWSHNHVLKMFVISQVQIFSLFYLFGKLVNTKEMYYDFGFTEEQPTLIGLMIAFAFIFAPIMSANGLLMTYLTRVHEFQADEFAKNLGKTAMLKSALVNLSLDNLGFPVSDPYYSAVHHSHPTLVERLAALDEQKVD